jgi:LPS-assembly lipoprotein
MSSSDRRGFLAALAALPLAACGFSPVYGPGGGGDRLRGRIAFADPSDALSFALVGRLRERIGQGAGPYRLDYTITRSEAALGITGAQDVNRIRVNGVVSFTVTDTASGAEVQSGSVSTFTAFASSGSPVATAAARRDADLRLMTALADQIVSQLLARAAGWA